METKLIIRTSHVERWQIVRTARKQTLAEHCYLVAMLAMKIATEVGFDKRVIDDSVTLALFHDAPETVYGDLATPVKSKITFEDSGIIEDYDLIKEKTKGQVSCKIVKLADLLEAMIFINIEGMSNHAKAVQSGLELKLYDLLKLCKAEFPDKNWDVVNTIKWEGLNV